MNCARCGRRLREPTWLRHSRDCARFASGACKCAARVHEACTKPRQSSQVTPLAAQIRAAHDRQLIHPLEAL